MVIYHRYLLFVWVALIAGIFCVSCGGKKEGKVVVSEQSFFIRHDDKINWVIDAKGKIRNVGDVDVKKVVVTGYCRSCGEILTAGIWFVSNVEKTGDQKDVISYLAAGDEAEFSIKEIAFYFNQSGQGPEGLPENLEVVVESFDVVE